MNTHSTSGYNQSAIEQFYYQEARLLDNRQYQQWLGLLAEDIVYTMPARINPMINPREQGNEDMISVERELEHAESANANPLREENLFHLAMRVERAYKRNSWAENPPAITRRIIGNVELGEEKEKRISVLSNFILYYSRHDDSSILSGQRRDELLYDDENFKIGRRQLILDCQSIDMPTVSLLL